MRWFLTAILIIAIAGCSSNNNSKTEDYNLLSNKYKDNFLFLSFWPGMSEADFNTIIKYETKKGNLIDNKFNLLIPRYDAEYDKIPFLVKSTETSIELEYFHDLWLNWSDVGKDDYNTVERLAEKKANEYLKIKDYLVATFDAKYKRIDTDQYIWLYDSPNEKKKIIQLDFDYWHFVFDEKYNNRTYGKRTYIYIDEKKKRYKAAATEINISYEFYDTYIDRQMKRGEEIRQYQEQKEKEKSEFDKKIDENKSRL